MVWGIPGIQRAVERHFQTHMRGGEDEVLADAAWPVGSVFISVVATDPSTLLGFGTWAAFGAGRVLVGLNAADADFDVVEETGGAKTSTPSAHAGSAVANHAFTQPSAHATHTAHGTNLTAVQSGVGTNITEFNGSNEANHAAHTANHSGGGVDAHGVTQPSAHSALSVVQPYIIVYMWKRTA